MYLKNKIRKLAMLRCSKLKFPEKLYSILLAILVIMDKSNA